MWVGKEKIGNLKMTTMRLRFAILFYRQKMVRQLPTLPIHFLGPVETLFMNVVLLNCRGFFLNDWFLIFIVISGSSRCRSRWGKKTILMTSCSALLPMRNEKFSVPYLLNQFQKKPKWYILELWVIISNWSLVNVLNRVSQIILYPCAWPFQTINAQFMRASRKRG